MRTASGAMTPDSTAPSKTFARWYNEPASLLTLMQTYNAAAPVVPSLCRSRASMIWMAGHLMHGSGFTAQVLAARKSLGSGLPFYRRQTGYSYRCVTSTVDYGTGRRVPINEAGILSTSVQLTDLPVSSRTKQEPRRVIPSSLKTR